MAVWRIALAGKMLGTEDLRNVFTIAQVLDVFPDWADILGWFDGMFDASTLSIINNSFTFERLIVEKYVAGHWTYIDEHVYSRVGTASGDGLPLQMAGVLVGITPSRRRGKKFIAGLTEASGAFGILTPTALGILGTLAAKWVAPSSVNPIYDWGSGVCKPDGSSFIEFTGWRVNTLMGTQRRRKPGVGS